MGCRYVIAGIVATMVVWLAACSGQAGQQAPLPSPTVEAPASVTSPVPPPVTSPPRAATPVTPGAAAGATIEVYAGVPRSRTPEGYHLLGNPEAPVTLVMYSDFL